MVAPEARRHTMATDEPPLLRGQHRRAPAARGDESVDLVYLDPPFNSNANYNVLFAEHDGTKAASQIKAFEDTWEWDETAARAFEEVVEQGARVPGRERHVGLSRHDGSPIGRVAPSP